MPALYRIHEPPDPLKVLQFEEFVSAFGFSLAAPSRSKTVSSVTVWMFRAAQLWRRLEQWLSVIR